MSPSVASAGVLLKVVIMLLIIRCLLVISLFVNDLIVGLSAVCDCGISRSYSLTFLVLVFGVVRSVLSSFEIIMLRNRDPFTLL